MSPPNTTCRCIREKILNWALLAPMQLMQFIFNLSNVALEQQLVLVIY